MLAISQASCEAVLTPKILESEDEHAVPFSLFNLFPRIRMDSSTLHLAKTFETIYKVDIVPPVTHTHKK